MSGVKLGDGITTQRIGGDRVGIRGCNVEISFCADHGGDAAAVELMERHIKHHGEENEMNEKELPKDVMILPHIAGEARAALAEVPELCRP